MSDPQDIDPGAEFRYDPLEARAGMERFLLRHRGDAGPMKLGDALSEIYGGKDGTALEIGRLRGLKLKNDVDMGKPGALWEQVESYGQGLEISGAIRKSAAENGVPLDYMLNTAAVESRFDPLAKAEGSTARGLYQFTDQTWLSALKRFGPDHGYGEAAEKITDGKVAKPADKADKAGLLKLRDDPHANAMMAGALSRDNLDYLKSHGGGHIGAAELYSAHFLGAPDAASYLGALRNDPGQSAARVLPEAASSNPQVFFDRDGNERSLHDLSRGFDAKMSHFRSAPEKQAEPRMAQKQAPPQPGHKPQTADASPVSHFSTIPRLRQTGAAAPQPAGPKLLRPGD
jgi:hypothetical protein